MIWFLIITTGLLTLAALAKYPIALQAASYQTAPARVRPGRRGCRESSSSPPTGSGSPSSCLSWPCTAVVTAAACTAATAATPVRRPRARWPSAHRSEPACRAGRDRQESDVNNQQMIKPMLISVGVLFVVGLAGLPVLNFLPLPSSWPSR